MLPASNMSYLVCGSRYSRPPLVILSNSPLQFSHLAYPFSHPHTTHHPPVCPAMHSHSPIHSLAQPLTSSVTPSRPSRGMPRAPSVCLPPSGVLLAPHSIPASPTPPPCDPAPLLPHPAAPSPPMHAPGPSPQAPMALTLSPPWTPSWLLTACPLSEHILLVCDILCFLDPTIVQQKPLWTASPKRAWSPSPTLPPLPPPPHRQRPPHTHSGQLLLCLSGN